MADEESPYEGLDIGYVEWPMPTTQELSVIRFLDKTGVANLWTKINDKFFKIPYGGEDGQVLSKSTSGTSWSSVNDLLDTVPISKGGTGATTSDGLKTVVFDFDSDEELITYIREASAGKHGLVEFASNEQFCEYMGKEYNPDDWGTEDSGDSQAISLNQLAYSLGISPTSSIDVSSATPTLRQIKYLSDQGFGSGGGYEQLDYITTNGSQWINTGYFPTSNTRLVMDAQLISAESDWSCFYGERGDLGSGLHDQFALWRTQSGQYRCNYNSDNGITAGTSDLERHIFDQNKNVQYIDGVAIATNSASTFTAKCPLYLFACNTNNSNVEYPSIIRFYSCKIYENDGLVRDFVPVRKASDGTIGLLDRVQDIFYGNAGTGSFAPGPPAGFVTLEWIETNGKAVIDTEYIPQPSTKITADFIPYTTSTFLFGSETAWNNDGLGWVDYIWENGSETYNFMSSPGSLIGKGRISIICDGKNWSCSTGLSHVFTDSITGNNGRSLYIFATNRGGVVTQPGNFRIYSFQIYENDILIRNFIPMQRTSDSICGLYDTVGEKFYTNIVSGGTIKAGPVLGGFRDILPDGYTWLEYIQNSGTQFITTDYYPNQDTRVECVFKADKVIATTSVNDGIVYGSGVLYNNRAFECFAQQGGLFTYGNGGLVSGFGLTDGAMCYATQNGRNALMNGSSKQCTASTFTTPVPLEIFATNRTDQGRSITAQSTGLKIYSLSIWEGTSCVRQFIPCKTSDGEVGMFEQVTNTFYGNSGTGLFISGPEMN